uniref:Separase n=1 Tax=Macrostomum lignano TaxID=282301 RepID=A0A1I8F909_9PLAT
SAADLDRLQRTAAPQLSARENRARLRGCAASAQSAWAAGAAACGWRPAFWADSLRTACAAGATLPIVLRTNNSAAGHTAQRIQAAGQSSSHCSAVGALSLGLADQPDQTAFAVKRAAQSLRDACAQPFWVLACLVPLSEGLSSCLRLLRLAPNDCLEVAVQVYELLAGQNCKTSWLRLFAKFMVQICRSRRHPQESGLAASALRCSSQQLLIETPGCEACAGLSWLICCSLCSGGSPTDWQLAEHPVSRLAVEYRCLTSSALAVAIRAVAQQPALRLVSGLLRSGPDQRASDSRPGIHSLLRLGNVAAFDTRDFNRDLAAVTCDLAEHFSVLPLDLDETDNKDSAPLVSLASSLICVAPTSFAGRSEVRIHRVAGVTSAAVKLSAAAESDVDDSAAAVAAFHAMYRGLSPAGLNNIAPAETAGRQRTAQAVLRTGWITCECLRCTPSAWYTRPAPLGCEDDGSVAVAAEAGSEVRGFPRRDSDATGRERQRSGRHQSEEALVGNDLTAVIYQEAGSRYGVESIATQCLFSHLVIQPLPNGLNRVRLVVKDVPGLADSFSDWRLCLVATTRCLWLLAVALLTDLAAQVATVAPRDAANPWWQRLSGEAAAAEEGLESG